VQSKPAKPMTDDLTYHNKIMGREDCQAGWHQLAADLDLGTVLDVGAGLCESKKRIRLITTQDVAYGLPGVDICADVSVIRDRSFDAVTAFDVIEHVVEDVDFLQELCRIARKWVLVTTPNYNVSKCANGCHCREYTPKEFFDLMDRIPNCLNWIIESCWSGDGDGFKRIEQKQWSRFVTHQSPHHAILIKRMEDIQWTPSV
jgi:hypothetical protein